MDLTISCCRSSFLPRSGKQLALLTRQIMGSMIIIIISCWMCNAGMVDSESRKMNTKGQDERILES